MVKGAIGMCRDKPMRRKSERQTDGKGKEERQERNYMMRQAGNRRRQESKTEQERHQPEFSLVQQIQHSPIQ